jgi:hypothetical protein
LPAVSVEGLPAVRLGGAWDSSNELIPHLEPCASRLTPQYRYGLEKSAMPSHLTGSAKSGALFPSKKVNRYKDPQSNKVRETK